MSEIKVNSVSGVTYHVEDLARTGEFYEALGFRRGKEEQDRVTFYVNWFFVTFVAQATEASNKGAGVYLYVKVDDIADFHQAVLSQGMKPEGEPQVQPSGNREFVLRDPDGYNVVLFQKK
jgi:catechol 2,3-dioxygenase-like lactoylglutathione lyase family enzyme